MECRKESTNAGIFASPRCAGPQRENESEGGGCAMRVRGALREVLRDRFSHSASFCSILDMRRSPLLGCRSRVLSGRLTQWESATFTRWKSLVQIQYRPSSALFYLPAEQTSEKRACGTSKVPCLKKNTPILSRMQCVPAQRFSSASQEAGGLTPAARFALRERA